MIGSLEAPQSHHGFEKRSQHKSHAQVRKFYPAAQPSILVGIKLLVRSLLRAQSGFLSSLTRIYESQLRYSFYCRALFLQDLCLLEKVMAFVASPMPKGGKEYLRSPSCTKIHPSSFILLVFAGLVLFHTYRSFDEDFQRTRKQLSPLSTVQLEIARVKPLIVVVAGGHRVGSTHLYNVLRVLMMIRDPNLISGAPVHLEKIIPAGENSAAESFNRVKLIRSHGSAIIKSHEMEQFQKFVTPNNGDENFLDGVDLIVLPFRDVRHQINSRARMGWGDLVQNNSDGWVQAAREEIKLHSVWEIDSINTRADSWKIVKPKVLEVKYEEWTGNQSKSTFDKVQFFQQFLKLDNNFTPEELALATVMINRLHPPECNGGINCKGWHLTNWMHIRHQEEALGKGTSISGGRSLVEDEDTRRWMLKHGYF